MSTRTDPFTTAKARVILSDLDAQRDREGRAHLATIQSIYGDAGAVQYRQYFGFDGFWRAGYRSEFGFHVRGKGDSAAAAVAQAAASRLPDDPCPTKTPSVSAGSPVPPTPPVRSEVAA